jgi:hypothetical protein
VLEASPKDEALMGALRERKRGTDAARTDAGGLVRGSVSSWVYPANPKRTEPNASEAGVAETYVYARMASTLYRLGF